MKNKKKTMIIAAIIMLAIGFASISATLLITGVIKIGVNADDYDVIFTKAKIGNVDQRITKTTKDSDTIEFETPVLKSIDDEAVLEYDVKNNSTQYDAKVKMKCYATSDTNSLLNTYVSVTGLFDDKNVTFGSNATSATLSDEVVIAAQGTKSGTITMKLIKSYAGTEESNEASLSIKCELTAEAGEKSSGNTPATPVKLAPGLYDENDTMTYTWEKLKSNGLISVNNGEVRGPRDFDKRLELVGNLVLDEEVTKIGDSAFAGCIELTSIEIPDSVTSIGNNAFEEGGLTSVTIGSGVTSIGEDVFTNCFNLTRIKIDENNPTYDSRDNSNAIIETATNKLIQGAGNTTIPNSVTSIGERAFSSLDNLTSIEIPGSVTSIEDWAFSSCDNLTSVTIRNGVTSIGNMAFFECWNLTNVTIENGVTSIGDEAFAHSGITSIEIPASVTSIGEKLFSYTEITSITVDENNTVYDSRNNCNAIIETATNKLIQGSNNTTIPNSVTSIGASAFDETGITSIEIPASVTSIGDHAFSYCSNLTSATFVNPNGWQAGSTALSSTDLADTSTAATYLKSTYVSNVWTRS